MTQWPSWSKKCRIFRLAARASQDSQCTETTSRLNRLQGTPEEYKAAVHGCNPHWGRYAVTSDGAIVFKIEHAMFPNWEGMEQKRPFSISGDELRYKVPAASGGGKRRAGLEADQVGDPSREAAGYPAWT